MEQQELLERLHKQNPSKTTLSPVLWMESLKQVIKNLLGPMGSALPAWMTSVVEPTIPRAQTMRKVVDQYGAETLVPLPDAIAEMMRTELKHVVQPRTAELPSAIMPGALGQTYVRPVPQAPAQIPSYMAEIAQHFAMHGQGDLAQGIVNSVARDIQGQGNNKP